MQPKGTNRPLPAGGSSDCAAVQRPARFREKFRRIIAGGLYNTGLLRVARLVEGTHELRSVPGLRFPRLRLFSGSKFGVLCYHRVGTEGIPLFSRLDPRVFEAQMRYLKKRYRIVSMVQLCMELREERPVAPTLAITFDDGYRDLYAYAFPILRRYEIPATIYLIGRSMETGEVPWYDRIFMALNVAPGTSLDLNLDGRRRFEFVSREARLQAAWSIVCFLRTIPDARRREWCASFERQFPMPQSELEGRMLTWDQVRTMHRGGVFFGAHTMTHPVVSQIPSCALEEELGRSKRFLENGLGASIEDFAYPFGKAADWNPGAEDFLARCGYRSAVTTVEGVNTARANLLALRRLQIDDDPSLPAFAFSVSRMFLEYASGLSDAASGTPGYQSLRARPEPDGSRL